MADEVEDVAAGEIAARRRARMAGGRGRRFYVKASPQEEARLVELAARRGVSVPRLLVESTLAPCAGASSAVVVPSAHPAVVTELTAMTRALARVGVNVNQIARATNATRETQPGTAVAVAVEAVAHVAARLDALLDELRGTGGRGSAAR